MTSTGVNENSNAQKRLSEYNHYAKKSLVLGILGFVSLFVFTTLTLIFASGYIFSLGCITSLTLLILGVVFGKKGLKSNKVGMSKVGLIVSIVGLSLPLLVIIIIILYVLTGGEFA